MKNSNNLNRDIIVGICLIIGVFVFMTGNFIFSTLLFAIASLFSNLDFRHPIKA